MMLHHVGQSWNVASVDTAISVISLMFYSLNLLVIFTFYQPGKANQFYRIAFIFAFTVFNSLTIRFILSTIYAEDEVYLNFLKLSMPIRSAFSLLILTFISVITYMLSRLEEQRSKEKRIADAEQLAKEAELSVLRQKLQPHFLFNSLNSISALAISQPDEARNMIHQLSDFLRGTMKKDDQKLVPFEEELNHLNLYLEIEKVRFGHRLKVLFEVDEQTLKCHLPPLAMQPIVENAIKFGLYGTLEETAIEIKAEYSKGYLLLKVINGFDADSQGEGSGTGFGLSSIQRRLFLLYARNDLIKTEKTENTFTTTLKIPQ